MCPSTGACEGAQTLYIHQIWIWDAVSRSVQPLPWHHNVIWALPHPQEHVNVLKHFIYIKHGYEMQSVGVYSLIHDNTMLFSKFWHPPAQVYNRVRVHPYDHPQHMKSLEPLYTFNMDMGCSQWGCTASNMSPQCHLGSALPQFSNFEPHMHRLV